MADLDTKLPDATEAPPGASTTSLRALAAGGGGGDATKFLNGSGTFSAPGGGGVTIQSTGPIAISSAELLAAHDTPVVLVEAPGSGKGIVPLIIVISEAFNSAGYTDSGTDIFWGTTIKSTILETSNWQVSGGFSQSSDNSAVIAGITNAVDSSAAISAFENQPLTLFSYIGDMTDGDGPVTITVLYTTLIRG